MTVWAVQRSPNMGTRTCFFDNPSAVFGVSNRLADVFVGMIGHFRAYANINYNITSRIAEGKTRHNKRIDRSRQRLAVIPMPYNGFKPFFDGSVILRL